MRKMALILCAVLVALQGPGLCADGADHWANWRGPFGTGMAHGDAPTEWSDTKNIKWKTDIPGRGHSTPIIWGDRKSVV